MDPPSHTILRTLVSRAFTPRRMAQLDDHIRDICAELLDPLVGRDEFDYVQDFAAQVPSRVIAELVGVPEDEREEQRKNIDAVFHIEPGVGMINDVSLTAQIALHTYLSGLIERKKDEPGDDLISVLCGSSIVDDDGVERRLTDKELADFTNLLFSAGTETVMRLLGNAAVLLAGHPDQRADLVANPDGIPNAVEELLRYEAPSPVQGRYTTRDIELHGTVVPAGSKVLLITGSAGRDEREYGPTPTASTCAASSASTSRSATASTSASAPTSPASRAASPSRRRSSGSRPGTSSPAAPSASTPAPCGATRRCSSAPAPEPGRPSTT